MLLLNRLWHVFDTTQMILKTTSCMPLLTICKWTLKDIIVWTIRMYSGLTVHQYFVLFFFMPIYWWRDLVVLSFTQHGCIPVGSPFVIAWAWLHLLLELHFLYAFLLMDKHILHLFVSLGLFFSWIWMLGICCSTFQWYLTVVSVAVIVPHVYRLLVVKVSDVVTWVRLIVYKFVVLLVIHSQKDLDIAKQG